MSSHLPISCIDTILPDNILLDFLVDDLLRSHSLTKVLFLRLHASAGVCQSSHLICAVFNFLYGDLLKNVIHQVLDNIQRSRFLTNRCLRLFLVGIFPRLNELRRFLMMVRLSYLGEIKILDRFNLRDRSLLQPLWVATFSILLLIQMLIHLILILDLNMHDFVGFL